MASEFEALIKDYGPLLSRVANSYEANPALQQELLQEIALAVWQGLTRFEHKSALKTYILKIAHNRAISHVASEVRRPSEEQYDDTQFATQPTHTGPEQTEQQRRKLERLLHAVRQLPLPARQVVTLSLEGLSYQEIADVCGLTTSHVGVVLKRARASLTRIMQDD